jgi:NAD(P)H dehydrogenase (quinone)
MNLSVQVLANLLRGNTSYFRLAEFGARAGVRSPRGRLRGAAAGDAPIPFRSENGGDFDEDQVLRPEIAAEQSGFDVHRR